jgi:hypothetical protein
MSFVENLYLKRQLQALQEENKKLKDILNEAPGDRLQRLYNVPEYNRYRYRKNNGITNTRNPYPGRHPTKYEGGYSLQLMPMYPETPAYPYEHETYPGQHPVKVNEAADDGSFGPKPGTKPQKQNYRPNVTGRFRKGPRESLPQSVDDGGLGGFTNPPISPIGPDQYGVHPGGGQFRPNWMIGSQYGYWILGPNGVPLWVPDEPKPLEPLNPGDVLPHTSNPYPQSDPYGSFPPNHPREVPGNQGQHPSGPVLG